MSQLYRVSNQSRALQKPLVLKECASFWSKTRGLSWRWPIAEEQGVLLVANKVGRQGTAIHMLGVFFHLTVVWLDKAYEVVDVQKAYAWRSFLFPQNAAKYVLECRLARFEEFRPGDQLALETL